MDSELRVRDYSELIGRCQALSVHVLSACPVFSRFPSRPAPRSYEDYEALEDAAALCHPEAFEDDGVGW